MGDGENFFLAMHARCPHCLHRFSICCAITHDKQIVKIPLSTTMMKKWISWSLRKQVNKIINNKMTDSNTDTSEFRAALPILILRWWVNRALQQRTTEQFIENKSSLLVAKTADHLSNTENGSPEDSSMLSNELAQEPLPPQSVQDEEITLLGEVIGYLGSLPIVEFFDYQEKRYCFSRVCHGTVSLVLTESEQLYKDVLIYTTELK